MQNYKNVNKNHGMSINNYDIYIIKKNIKIKLATQRVGYMAGSLIMFEKKEKKWN